MVENRYLVFQGKWEFFLFSVFLFVVYLTTLLLIISAVAYLLDDSDYAGSRCSLLCVDVEGLLIDVIGGMINCRS